MFSHFACKIIFFWPNEVRSVDRTFATGVRCFRLIFMYSILTFTNEYELLIDAYEGMRKEQLNNENLVAKLSQIFRNIFLLISQYVLIHLNVGV